MKCWIPTILALGFLAGTVDVATAADDRKLSVGGRVYFDYFADLTDRPDADPTPVRGFETRRVYLTTKIEQGDFLFRYTTDIDTKFGTGNLNVFTKYAYVQHRGLIPGAKVFIGQHSPNSNGWTEKMWGFRSVEKVMSDLAKWTHSAQFGIGVQGKAADGTFEYSLDANNGNGYKESVAKDGWGVAGRAVYHGPNGFLISGLATANAPGGVFSDDSAANFAGPVALDGADIYLEGTAGWKGERGAAYAQYGRFTDDQFVSGGLAPSGSFGDRESSGISVFGRVRANEDVSVFGRVDVVDPDTSTSDDASTWFLAGVDWPLGDGLFLQPNYRHRTYEASGVDDEDEIRVTFYGKI